MEFTSLEKQAVVCLMELVIEADSWIDEDEIEIGDELLDAFDCTDEDFDLGQEMPVLSALYVLKGMEDEKKEVVSDIMTTLIVADRVITDEEVAVFAMVEDLIGIKTDIDHLATEAD